MFLEDRTSLVSYGEFARVGNRVVFSMPNPPLDLVNISGDRVDWDRTNRYADSARIARYVATRAEDDYVALTNEIARTLDEVAFTNEASKHLVIVENARKMLAVWPQNHFNYRRAEVRQMLLMLDEAIADLRTAAGDKRFELSLVTIAEPPPPVSLLPVPTTRETIEQVLRAADLSDSVIEREALLDAALRAIEDDAPALPVEWAASTRARTKAAIDAERQTDRTYQAMTKLMLARAKRRRRYADVRGLEQLLLRIHRRDAALGAKRPDAVNALIATVQAQLDGARRVRLAREWWALRTAEFKKYYAAIGRSVVFSRLTSSLEDIKLLASSTPASLAAIHRSVSQIVSLAPTIAPPEEVRATHALFVSAVQLADNAARIRREATLSGDMARAWDASSAAAGGLMLGACAKSEIQALLRPPPLQ